MPLCVSEQSTQSIGYAIASIEGRVALEFFDTSPSAPQSFAFKCHRGMENGQQILYPVNTIAFHPQFGSFATGGCDGVVAMWDGITRKKICQFSPYPTSISSLSFSPTSNQFAIAVSYTWENGEKSHPKDEIVIRQLDQNELISKSRMQTLSKV
jgi:cell cycle arrest protein BUB3